MEEAILFEIALLPADRSRGRHNPRAVKRKMSHFPTTSRAQPLLPPKQRLIPMPESSDLSLMTDKVGKG